VLKLVATPNSRYLLVDFARNVRWIAFDRSEALQLISKVCSVSIYHPEYNTVIVIIVHEETIM
jgi:hypothetical protein